MKITAKCEICDAVYEEDEDVVEKARKCEAKGKPSPKIKPGTLIWVPLPIPFFKQFITVEIKKKYRKIKYKTIWEILEGKVQFEHCPGTPSERERYPYSLKPSSPVLVPAIVEREYGESFLYEEKTHSPIRSAKLVNVDGGGELCVTSNVFAERKMKPVSKLTDAQKEVAKILFEHFNLAKFSRSTTPGEDMEIAKRIFEAVGMELKAQFAD